MDTYSTKKTMTKIRTYTELSRIVGYENRFQYLKLSSAVGQATFGFERYLNQSFYQSSEWRRIRRKIIIRDNGCDLGDPDREINEDCIHVHHMNPITVDDIVDATEYLCNPEYLICCSDRTHRAIHYGNKSSLLLIPTIRTPNDMCPWK